MSVKWYLLKELKLSFKTLGLDDCNDSFIHRKNASMLRKTGVWRKLPGGSRIGLSAGSTLPSLAPSPASITSHGGKASPRAFISHREVPRLHSCSVSTPMSCVQLPQLDGYHLVSYSPLSECVFKRNPFTVVFTGVSGEE